jgi:rod shape-determining protein MreD
MRSVATLAVGLLLLLLQSTVMEFAPVHLVTPSLGLLVVLYVGMAPLKWSPGSAVVVGFSMGYLFDLVSGAPRGVHAFVFVTLALIARVLAWRLAVRGIVLKAATSFVASIMLPFSLLSCAPRSAPRAVTAVSPRRRSKPCSPPWQVHPCCGCWRGSTAVSIRLVAGRACAPPRPRAWPGNAPTLTLTDFFADGNRRAGRRTS